MIKQEKKAALKKLYVQRPVTVTIGCIVMLFGSLATIAFISTILNHLTVALSLSAFKIMLPLTIYFLIYALLIGCLYYGRSIGLFFVYFLPLWFVVLSIVFNLFLLLIHPTLIHQLSSDGTVLRNLRVLPFTMVGLLFMKLMFFYKSSKQWFKDCYNIRKNWKKLEPATA